MSTSIDLLKSKSIAESEINYAINRLIKEVNMPIKRIELHLTSESDEYGVFKATVKVKIAT